MFTDIVFLCYNQTQRMKKLLTCFFALSIIAPTAFAVDGAISRAIPATGTETGGTRNLSGRTISRAAIISNTEKNQISDKANNQVRTTVSRVFTGADDKNIKKNDNTTVARSNVISRSVASGNTGARSALDAAVNTVGRNERVSAASINSDPAVRRAGLVLRPSVAEVGGRAIIGDTGIQTGSNIDESLRRVKTRAASVVATAESIAQATDRLEKTATLNKSCQEQYNECMDQFCAVIDANQKRCSCSANLSRYTKVETAVKDANTQLNEVAQRIRYVGLSADEIRAIMTETEAEEALSGANDNSETRNMLDEIEDLIRDPSAGSSYANDTSVGFDLDLDFSSDAADLFSLDFLNADNNSSFSNLRGTALYNAAKKRCNSVLTQCKEAGATTTQITGNYDLAIDKDCIAYEQGLNKMNETLVSNVRSANRMLQKARLSVLQNKNQYDAKGCVAALDTCMTDEMVCGSNYFKCIDPTKRYIDENGEVVLGQDISQITAFMENYNNASLNSQALSADYNVVISPEDCSGTNNDGSCVVKYLLGKIGTKQKVTDEGLCRAVLDKCQAYTYDSKNNYISYNDVVVNYVQRAMVNIRAAQHKIISEYASTCMTDVANCYNQQVSQVNAWSSNASVSNVYNVMRGACRNVALTCGYAVFDGTEQCEDPEGCINGVSEIFYQSLLCPDNSTYQETKCDKIGNGEKCVNTNCICNSGYEAWGAACVIKCDADAGEERNSYGVCTKN